MRAILFLLIAITCPLWAADDFDKQEIIERIKPLGQVHIEGQTNNQPVISEKVTKPVATAPGQAIYEKYCIVCHRDGVAGAPRFRNGEDWKPRLAKMKVDELTQAAIKGLNAMPAKGTCGECSDEDLTNAIRYMLPQS